MRTACPPGRSTLGYLPNLEGMPGLGQGRQLVLAGAV